MPPAIDSLDSAVQPCTASGTENEKLVVVGLPGWRTSGEILQAQLDLSGLTNLVKQKIEFVCINPPHLAEGPPDPLVEKLNIPGPYYQWTLKAPPDHDENTAHPGFFDGLKYFSKKLKEIEKSHGRVDGVLGFSQGGAMACLFQLCHLSGVAELPILPKFTILISAVVPEGVLRSKWMTSTERLRTPSLHIAGELDSYYLNSVKVSECAFQAPSFITHKQGHVVPRLAKEAQFVTDSILSFVDSMVELCMPVRKEEAIR